VARRNEPISALTPESSDSHLSAFPGAHRRHTALAGGIARRSEPRCTETRRGPICKRMISGGGRGENHSPRAAARLKLPASRMAAIPGGHVPI